MALFLFRHALSMADDGDGNGDDDDASTFFSVSDCGGFLFATKQPSQLKPIIFAIVTVKYSKKTK